MDFSKFQSHLSNLDKLEFRTPTRPFVPLLFLTQIAGARLRTGQHDLAVTCFYARSYVISVLVIGIGGSLQTVVKMFTDALWTSACCVSCWGGDQKVTNTAMPNTNLGRQGSQKSGKATRRNIIGYKYRWARPSRLGLVHENQDAFRRAGHDARPARSASCPRKESPLGRAGRPAPHVPLTTPG